MNLYHVSCKKYEVGELLSSKFFDQTHYYKNAKEGDKGWIDEILDDNRPGNAPERKNALFAFSSLANCVTFIKNNCEEKTYYYRIKMNESFSCPMCLTDALVENDQEINNKIVQEYWEPKENWKYLEYIGTEMEILEILEKPDFIEQVTGQENYQHDYDLRKTLYR